MRLGSSQHNGIKKLKEKEYVAVYTAAPSVVRYLFFRDSTNSQLTPRVDGFVFRYFKGLSWDAMSQMKVPSPYKVQVITMHIPTSMCRLMRMQS